MIRAWGNRLLLKALSEEELADQTEGGLWLPPTAVERQRHRQWEIVDVGPDVEAPELLPGLRVIAPQWAGRTVTVDGYDYQVIFEEQLIAVV